MSEEHNHWHENGVKVISGDHLDINTAQTPGMNRELELVFPYIQPSAIRTPSSVEFLRAPPDSMCQSEVEKSGFLGGRHYSN